MASHLAESHALTASQEAREEGEWRKANTTLKTSAATFKIGGDSVSKPATPGNAPLKTSAATFGVVSEFGSVLEPAFVTTMDKLQRKVSPKKDMNGPSDTKMADGSATDVIRMNIEQPPMTPSTTGGTQPKVDVSPTPSQLIPGKAAVLTKAQKQAIVTEVTRDLIRPGLVATKYGIRYHTIFNLVHSAGLRMPGKYLKDGTRLSQEVMAHIKQVATDEDKVLEMAKAHGLSLEDVRTVASYSPTKISDAPPAARKRPHEGMTGTVIPPEVRAEWIKWHDQDLLCPIKCGTQTWDMFLQHMHYWHGPYQPASPLTDAQKTEWSRWHESLCDFRTSDWDLFVMHINFDHPGQLPPPVLDSPMRDLNSNKV